MMKNLKIPNLAWASSTAVENNISNTIGLTKRKNMVNTTFYSVAPEHFYMMANPQVVAKFDAAMKDCENTNWSNFYRIDSKTKRFVHESMVLEWLKFIFGNDDCLREMGERRGLDEVKIEKIVRWRNKMVNGWKVIAEDDPCNEVGIYFCPKHAHARIAALIKQYPNYFGHITTCIVNGDKTTNRYCKTHIKHHMALWKYDRDENGKPKTANLYMAGTSKFVILMDGMGNRSLSIKQITWAIITGNGISYASYDQKTARVRTEWGIGKEAFILDFTLNKEGYSFNAESLIRHHAERNGRNITYVIDEFTKYKTFMKIACSLDGECESVFTKSDYYDYVRNLSTIVREGRFVNAELFTDEILAHANRVADDKKMKEVKNEVKFSIEPTCTPGSDKKPSDGSNDGVNTSGSGDKKEKTPVDRQIVANIFHNLVSHPRTLMIKVSGESSDTPLVARWAAVRDGFVESYSYKYGKHVGGLLDAIMEVVAKDDVWNKMVLATAADYEAKVDLAYMLV